MAPVSLVLLFQSSKMFFFAVILNTKVRSERGLSGMDVPEHTTVLGRRPNTVY